MLAKFDMTRSPFRQQKEWGLLIVSAFFLGGLGAGTFIIGTYLGMAAVSLIGYLILVIGKNGCHILYLGRPERFWRMMSRPRTSWIARGAFGILVFSITALPVILHQLHWINLSTGWYRTLTGISFAAAFWVMLYTGFVMSASPSMPAWNSTLIPLLFVLYGFLGGLDIALIAIGVTDTAALSLPVPLTTVKWWEMGLLLGAFLLLVQYIAVMATGTRTTREAARRLLRGELAKVFLGGVVVLGAFVPVALMALEIAYGYPAWFMIATGILGLVGSYSFRWSLLRIGLYAPLL